MFLPSNITLKFGDSGDFVAELQRRLAMVRCFDEAQVNGFYDGVTVTAVTQFQGSNGLHADGVAGPETLRRLNGVIAGDTSGSTADAKQEEEKQAAASREQVLNYTLAQEAPSPAQWGGEGSLPREEAAPAAAPQAGGLDPAMFAPPVIEQAAPISQLAAPSPLEMAERANRDAPPVSNDPVQDLNAMLGEASRHQQQMQAAAAPPLQPAPAPAQPLEQPQQLPPVAATAIPVSRPFEPALTEPPAAAPAAPAAPAEPPSLMQRASRFANAVVQKLADYFEAKLPPSALKEVQAIGQAMAQHGVREAPIPTGPEFGGREQLPARGPEPQQGQIR